VGTLALCPPTIAVQPHRRHCEEQSDEAIHISCAEVWDASRSLSSGAHSRDPLARNDEVKNLIQISDSYSVVIPGRREAVSPESITTIVSMDSGLAPSGAPRNDDGVCKRDSAFPRHVVPGVMQHRCPSKEEGAGNGASAMHPQPCVQV